MKRERERERDSDGRPTHARRQRPRLPHLGLRPGPAALVGQGDIRATEIDEEIARGIDKEIARGTDKEIARGTDKEIARGIDKEIGREGERSK